MDSARWLEAGEPQATLGTGGRRALLLLLGLTLVAVWSEHLAAVFFILSTVGVLLLARAWANRSLARLVAVHELDQDRAFPGESLRLRVVATNDKWLPLTWLRVRSALPAALTPTGSPRRWPGNDRGGYLQGMGSIGWFGQAAWVFEVPCRTRGVYYPGPLEVTTGDPFGFESRRLVLDDRPTVVVYPRIVPLRRLGFVQAGELGPSVGRNRLQEDAHRSAGVRAYQPGDPLRRIHWKATARQRELLVRLLEPSTAPLLQLVLASDSFDFPWTRYREDMLDLAASALGSIGWHALEDGWPVGLVVSGPEPIVLPAAASPRQLNDILEALARATASVGRPLDEVLAEQQRGPRVATYVVAAGRDTPGLARALDRLTAAHTPFVQLFGDEPSRGGSPRAIYKLRHWDDLAATLEGPGEPRHGG
jgi:uncharacterized protein (DUF58 family)